MVDEIQDLLDELEEKDGGKKKATKEIKKKVKVDVTGMIKIKKLKFVEGNRDAKPKRVDELAESIKEFGVLIPIIINKKQEIIDGERRVRACLKLGLDEIPHSVKNTDFKKTYVVANYVRENLTEAQVREVLSGELKEKGKTQKQIAKEFGISQGRVSQITNVKKKCRRSNAKKPKPVKPVILPENVHMKVGRNKVMITFSLTAEMLERPLKSIGLLFKEIKDFKKIVKASRGK